MTEPFQPIPYRDRLGRRMVIVEVPKPTPPSKKVERLHGHVNHLGGALYRSKHKHLVDVDAPEHIHGDEPDVPA